MKVSVNGVPLNLVSHKDQTSGLKFLIIVLMIFFLFFILDAVNFADDNSPFSICEKTFEILNKLEIEAELITDYVLILKNFIYF